jgi:hypothetical protein
LPRANAARSVLLEWNLRRTALSVPVKVVDVPLLALGEETGGAPIGHLTRAQNSRARGRIEPSCYRVNKHVLIERAVTQLISTYLYGANPQAGLSPRIPIIPELGGPNCPGKTLRAVFC